MLTLESYVTYVWSDKENTVEKKLPLSLTAKREMLAKGYIEFANLRYPVVYAQACSINHD